MKGIRYRPRKIKAPNSRESSLLRTIGTPTSSLFPPFAIQPAKQGVAAKISPNVLTRIPKLVEAFARSVQTDLGSVEASQLACLAATFDSKQIQFFEFPESLFTLGCVQDPVLGNTSILNADFNILELYVQTFNKDLWPPSNEELYYRDNVR